MLDKLELSAFTNHHNHFIRVEKHFDVCRFFLGRKHFKTFQLQAVKMPEPGSFKFFLHQEMNAGGSAVYIMKFKPGNFFIQYEITAQVAVNQIGYWPRHVCTEEFLRNQVTLRE